MNVIKAINLVHEYITRDENDNEEKIRAIDGVDIDVEAGQFIAILGRNGSGKSTLAKHINAILKPTSGTLFVNGMDSSDDENKWRIRKSAGMVFQNPDNQFITSVVEEDVGFGPENLGVPTDEIWERVNAALAATGMTSYRYDSPNRLSGGQKQRVAIAGILAMEPDCIVADEPTAMLDPGGRRDVIATLHELNKKRGVTVILITHHMEEASGADKIFVMDGGRIAMEGSPDEIFKHPDKIAECGLEMPQVTELAWKLKEEGFALDEGITDVDLFTDQILKNGIKA